MRAATSFCVMPATLSFRGELAQQHATPVGVFDHLGELRVALGALVDDFVEEILVDHGSRISHP